MNGLKRIGTAGVITAMVIVAGCGGSSGTSAKDYVHQVCGAFKTFETSLQAQDKAFQSAVQSQSSDASAIKADTVQYTSLDSQNGLNQPALKSAGDNDPTCKSLSQ